MQQNPPGPPPQNPNPYNVSPYNQNPYGDINYGLGYMPTGYRHPGMVGHVLVVSILQLVLSFAEIAVAAMFLLAGFANPNNANLKPQEAVIVSWMMTIFMILAVVIFAVALLR